MKDKIFGVLQRVGRSFMLPIALLPVAGLLLGLGSSFTNATTIETYHLGNIIYEGGLLYTILDIMSKAGSAVFDNLALLFAMGVSIGMAKKRKGSRCSFRCDRLSGHEHRDQCSDLCQGRRRSNGSQLHHLCAGYHHTANGRVRRYSGWLGRSGSAQPVL